MNRESTRDVPRSDVLHSEELHWLQSLHEGLPAPFAAALSAMLRSPVEARLLGIDQLAYGKFVLGLADPSYFSVLKADPPGDRVMLDIELSILYPLLDRLLGGGQADEPPPRRAASDIELPLAARIVRVFLDGLHQAWQATLPVQFETLQVEGHPRLLRVLPADENVAVLCFSLAIGSRQGMLRLCWPCRAIRQISQKLAQAQRSPSSAANDAATDADDSPTGSEVVVTLATTSIAAGDLATLRVGDTIVTETPADTPAVVLIDGQPCFHGRPGECDGRKAVVLSPLSPDAST